MPAPVPIAPRLRPLGRLACRILPLALAALLSCPSARAADPQPYAVVFEPTGEAALDTALRDSSDLASLRKKAPAGPFALVMRAQNDGKRLETALRAFGYYEGHAVIRIAGRAIDDPALPALLRARPAAPPAEARVAVARGRLFRLRRVIVQGDAPTDARAALGVKPGDPALAAPVLAAGARLLQALRESGHALARVADPAAVEIPSAGVLDITYKVEAGPRVALGPIGFQGLRRVSEAYVRERLLVRQGQLYQPDRIEVARQDLADTGVFSSVEAKAADHPDADGQLPLDFVVQERPRHVVGITGAYSTDLGGSLAATWSHRNLFGDAEQLNLRAAIINLGGSATDGIGYDADAQFVKPDFLRRNQSLTLNLEAIRQSFEAYDQTALLAGATVNRKLDRYWTASLGIQAEQERITQEGVVRDYTLAGLPLGAKYDSSDSLFAPTRGVRASLTATPTYSLGQGGQGGGAPFAVLSATGSTYFDLFGGGHSVVALRAAAGTVQGAGTYQIPPDQRLYAGGSATVRGYKYQSVGSQFPDRNPVGGTQLAAATVELRQHLFGSFGMAAFADAGEVLGARGRARGVAGPDTGGRLAVGAGIGARYATPIGPIRLDVAAPLQRFPGGDAFELYIGIGEAF